MAELKRWSGNDTTDISLKKNGYGEIIQFVRKYHKVYLFGNGHIGKAMEKYICDSGIKLEAVVTSENIDNVRHSIDKDSCIVMGIGDVVLPEVFPLVKGYFEEQNIYIPDIEVRESIGNILDEKTWRDNFWLNIYVTNKCNLGCRSCSAFAPICKPDFYELDSFKSDIRQMADIGLDKINELKFTGAEAILHPEIIEMLSFTRSIFPDIKIQIYTNGLFIKSYEESKLKRLAELNVILVVTEYPLPNLDLRGSYERLDSYGISYYVIYADKQKFFSKRPLRFEGDVPKERYIECPRYKMCKSLFLFRGKLFKCIYTISADYVNDAFHKHLDVKNGDYVDIYSSNPDSIYKYATSRIPFCDYCSPIEELVPWGVSEKKLEEWT